MGLDMYLYKAKKLKEGVTAKEIMQMHTVYIWQKRGQDYALADWCAIDEKEVDWNLFDIYKGEGKIFYAPWDLEKRWPSWGIAEKVGYWRKVNAIHSWFVNHVQDGDDDCGSYEVSKEKIEELKKICEEVVGSNSTEMNDVEHKKYDIEKAKEILPTQSGFFFGSTSYDETYFSDIEDTVKTLEKVLETTDFDKEMIIYRSSW